MSARGFNHFKTKQDGMERAKRVHLCLNCRATPTQIWTNCPSCGAPEKGNRQLIMSKAELKRAGELLLAQQLGQIRGLRFQPRYDLIVEGVKVARYTADFEYQEFVEADFLTENSSWKTVVEDTKPPGFMDKYAKLKIELFNALNAKHGLSVRISRR